MKTIKQIADELEVDKQKVYRYIKKNHIKEVNQKCISETRQRNNVKYYDEVAENLIKQGLSGDIESSEIHQEAHQNHINDIVIDTLLKQIEILKNELDVKNEQIREKDKQIKEKDNQIEALNTRIEESHRLLDQSQQLQAMEKKIKALEDKKEDIVEHGAVEQASVSESEPEQKEKKWYHFFRR